MAFEPKKLNFAGQVKEVTIGTGDKAVTVGGRNGYPFYSFESEMPRRPVIAMEIWDKDPSAEWCEAAKEPFKDVLGDPVAWAKKCVEYGAEMIVIQTKSADPNGDDKPAADVAAVVKKVVDAVDVPVAVWGLAAHDKDTDVLRTVAEQNAGKKMLLGPVEEGDYKAITAACMGYGHVIGASSPIDVNLAKQLNILMENLGASLDSLIIDPTTGGLGYGLEYSYSVMERITQAALLQGDNKLQNPMVNNVGNEVWKSKEANQTNESAPELGDSMKRGYLMETTAAICYLMAGSDILYLRHPETVKLVKGFLDKMMC